jgi:hypothetical protein
VRSPLRDLLLPAAGVWAPGTAMDVAGARRPAVAMAGLLLLVGGLGAAGLPRLLPLLAETIAPAGTPLLAAHRDALHAGLVRYLLADRLLPPFPFACAALLLALAAGPVLARRRVAWRAVWGVLAVGAAPLLVQRLGELGVVWAAAGRGLETGEVAGLAARFNVGVAGILAAAGAAPAGGLSVVAEAANAVGLWVVGLWGWGLARLDAGAAGAAAPRPRWPYLAAALAYALGYAAYAALLPVLLLLVMGLP